jgi:hypothetical protein
LQPIETVELFRGVRYASGILTQNRIFNRCAGFIFAESELPAAVRAIALLTGMACDAAAARLTFDWHIAPRNGELFLIEEDGDVIWHFKSLVAWQ